MQRRVLAQGNIRIKHEMNLPFDVIEDFKCCNYDDIVSLTPPIRII